MLSTKGPLAILACTLSTSPAVAQDAFPQLLFTNVNVFDGVNEALITNANVLVEGNLIKLVSAEPLDEEGVTVIDGGGRTMIPGLIDAHWHVLFNSIPQAELFQSDFAHMVIMGTKSAEATLLRGFTTVRDVGGNPFSIKKAIDAGVYPGPRIYPSGTMISQTGGHADFNPYTSVPTDDPDALSYLERNGIAMRADGVDQVTLRVRENLRMGASQIKIATGGGVSSLYDPLDVSEYTPEEIAAAVTVAENWGTYVATHTFTDRATQIAIEAGIKSVEHGFLLSEETLQMMADKGVWLSIQPLLNDEDAFTFADPVSTEKWIRVTDGTDTAYETANRLDVKVAFGTDILFDPAVAAKQGKFLSKLGRWYTPFETLKIATSENAELLALSGARNPYQEGPLGVIAEGAYADLILVDGNPLEDLDLVADPETNFDLIMKDGVVFKNTLSE
ncbi:metal-dependent hydrolase family protein [Alloyangia pacifica]|uniref:Imidazolonepropionase n=1 Tax=Alloyangia pacifica TaxID=311180 RepID=A0A1I6V229_9RHOB|nr:amidohydrolase family protein [Alloyangia pacifica]SDI88673.1 Imidazolonepropionase [Alloyangia pacifica]SFT07715.1 Imidazolonepropionase [Alloyangia pacifica]